MSFPLASRFPKKSELEGEQEDEIREQEPKDTLWQKQRAKEKNRKIVKDAIKEFYAIAPETDTTNTGKTKGPAKK